jgi:hypothetical protein
MEIVKTTAEITGLTLSVTLPALLACGALVAFLLSGAAARTVESFLALSDRWALRDPGLDAGPNEDAGPGVAAGGAHTDWCGQAPQSTSSVDIPKRIVP